MKSMKGRCSALEKKNIKRPVHGKSQKTMALTAEKKGKKRNQINMEEASKRVRTERGCETGNILSADEKKRLVKQKIREKKSGDIPKSTQETLPFEEMYKDGICRVNRHYFTKTIEFGDINYQLAQNEDKTAVFEYWCDFYNYFDASISVQLSCMSQRANVKEMESSIEIPDQDDGFDDIRKEYAGMLKT